MNNETLTEDERSELVNEMLEPTVELCAKVLRLLDAAKENAEQWERRYREGAGAYVALQTRLDALEASRNEHATRADAAEQTIRDTLALAEKAEARIRGAEARIRGAIAFIVAHNDPWRPSVRFIGRALEILRGD